MYVEFFGGIFHVCQGEELYLFCFSSFISKDMVLCNIVEQLATATSVNWKPQCQARHAKTFDFKHTIALFYLKSLSK